MKERLRARQSISSLHLHNKWSSHGFSSAHTRAHTPLMSVSTQRSSAHADARSERWGGRKRKREEERESKRPAICWSGTLQILTHWLYQKHKQSHGEHKVTKSQLLNTAAVKQTWILSSHFALSRFNRRDHGKERSKSLLLIAETISGLTEKEQKF